MLKKKYKGQHSGKFHFCYSPMEFISHFSQFTRSRLRWSVIHDLYLRFTSTTINPYLKSGVSNVQPAGWLQHAAIGRQPDGEPGQRRTACCTMQGPHGHDDQQQEGEQRPIESWLFGCFIFHHHCNLISSAESSTFAPCWSWSSYRCCLPHVPYCTGCSSSGMGHMVAARVTAAVACPML